LKGEFRVSGNYDGVFGRATIKDPKKGMQVNTIGNFLRPPPHTSAAEFDKRHNGTGILLEPIAKFEGAAWLVQHEDKVAPYWLDELELIKEVGELTAK
jgi:hypothetical protein